MSAAENGPQDVPKYLLITEAELFGALDLERAGLGKVKAAAEAKDWQRAGAEWGTHWASRKAPRYYVDGDAYAKGIAQHLPHMEDIVVADADTIWDDDFQFSTYKPKREGRSFAWVDQFDDTAYIGFLYFFWMKNLGRAYVLTGDEKYAVMFREIVCSLWDAAPGFGQARCGKYDPFSILWNNGLGSSLRCVLMMDSYWLMRGSPSFTPELHSKMLRLFLSHARYIHENHVKSYTHSNFQASECAWMVMAGVMLPELREAAAWRDVGVALTKERIRKNYDQDGAQLEQCPQYHLTGMRDITRVLLVLHANGLGDISGDGELWRKLERIYDYPIRITHPTGHLGVINSGVYGTEAQAFFPVGVRLFGSDLHRWASKRYVRPGFVPVAKNLSQFTLFMDGDWAQTLADARAADVPPPTFTNDLMADSGLAVLRSGWDADAFSLIFDFNRKPWGGHRYPGRLSFDLFAFGVPMVVNPGSTLSYSMPVYRKWCSQTIGHNTVMIDNRSHSDFTAEPVAWREGKKAVFVVGRIKSQGFVYQRSIVSVTGEYVFVFDRLTGKEGGVPLAWLLHSPLALSEQEGSIVGGGNGKPGLLIAPDSATRRTSEAVLGQGYAAVPVSYHKNHKPLDAWRDDVPYLRLNSETDATLGGQTYGVLLVPFRKTLPKVAVLTQDVPDATRLQVHSVTIQWPDRTDILTVDYRQGKTACRIERTDKKGKTLWSEE
jgi:hypothetical protein